MPTTPHSWAELDLAKVDWHRIDATTDEDIGRQTASDADTAPLFSAAEILTVGRRIEPAAVEPHPAPRHRPRTRRGDQGPRERT